MAKNDGGCGGGIDRDPTVASSGDIHVSDVAGAAVDGERRGDGDGAVAAAAEAIDLGCTDVDRSLERGTWSELGAGISVVPVWADPLLRTDRAG